jgi:CDGSH-type Zn-finger protein
MKALAYRERRISAKHLDLIVMLCSKRTEQPPHCDGSHIHIDWAALQW